MPPTFPEIDPVNEDMPPKHGLPRGPMGDIPVIARLVDQEGFVWLVPAKANRWTSSHVLITFPTPEGSIRPTRLAWLRARDVRRVIRYRDPKDRPSAADPTTSS